MSIGTTQQPLSVAAFLPRLLKILPKPKTGWKLLDEIGKWLNKLLKWNWVRFFKFTNAISGEHLHSIFMDDSNDPWRLEPSFAIYLDWHFFIAQNIDLHRMALCYSVMLEVYQSRGCHLYRSKNRYNFKHSIVKRWRKENITFFSASPKIRSSHKTKIETSFFSLCYFILTIF